MTLEEAKKFALVLQDVDNGCPNCILTACARTNSLFLDYNWTYDEEKGIVEVTNK